MSYSIDTPDPVQSYELFLVEPRWLFIRIVTEQGLVGWGEPNVEGMSNTVRECVREFMDNVVIGLDSRCINYIWQKLYRQTFYGGQAGGIVFMSALSGIDQALWDIHGKRLKVNVSILLGGAVRNKIQMYRWCGGDDNTAEEAAAEAMSIVQQSNFKLIKMNCTPRMGYLDEEGVAQAVERMKAVREAVGTGIGIGLDFHGRVKVPTVKKLIKALEPFDPLFYEEPVVKGQNKILKELSTMTSVPLATGERMCTVDEFRDLLEQRSVGLIQPDASHCGGITNLWAIARMADAYEVIIAPHCPLGPIALASCLVVDAVSLNFSFQESSLGIHYNSEIKDSSGDEGSQQQRDLLTYVQNKEDFQLDKRGCMEVLSRPGLGVVIDEDMVRRAAELGHNWKDREWELDDGSPTTW